MKPKKASSIKLMGDGGSMIGDQTEIANIFNDHFSTLGSKVQQKYHLRMEISGLTSIGVMEMVGATLIQMGAFFPCSYCSCRGV